MPELPYNGNYPPGMKESDIPGWNDEEECDEDEYSLYDDNEREYYREDYEEDER